MFKQHFIVEGKLLGTVTRKFIRYHAEIGPPRGEAFFCPECGRLWAQCPIEGEPCNVIARSCGRHESVSLIFALPGSLLQSWNPDFEAAFPKEALRRELSLLFKYYQEKENV